MTSQKNKLDRHTDLRHSLHRANPRYPDIPMIQMASFCTRLLGVHNKESCKQAFEYWTNPVLNGPNASGW